jgi:Domain of unknown function (DUF929)
MGKASRTKVETSRREKLAAQRAAARRSEQRKRILIASGSVVVVLAVVLTLIIIKLNNKPTPAAASSTSNGPTGAALTTLVHTVTSVPASTLDTVGAGTFDGKIQTSTGNPAPLTSGGKPELLYIGAEYCPYCAANRWAMIVALSRFGTFSGLATVHSGITNGAGTAEPYPNTPTFTFAKSTYTSPYLNFTPVETQTNIPDSTTGTYTALQTPTAAQQGLLNKYDTAPYIDAQYAGSIPFLDFGNKYVSIGVSYPNTAIQNMTWTQIAAALSNPNSTVAKAVDGTANYFTAAICKMTNNQPATACTAAVQSLESKLS